MNAEIRQIRTAAEQALLDAFPAVQEKLPGAAPERSSAFRRFEAAGLPHRRVEEWKYTDLRALMREAMPLAVPPAGAARDRLATGGRMLAKVGARRLVCANGAFVAEASDLAALEPGLTIKPLAAALADGDAWVAQRLGRTVATDDIAVSLNTAFMTDGFVIRVAAGAAIERPLHLVFAFTGEQAAAVFARSLVVVEEGARVTLIETHEGPAALDYQVNQGVELVVGDRAEVELVKIGAEGANALHVASTLASVGADARVNAFTFTTGSAVTRNQLFLRLDGPGTKVAIRGANLLNGRQHVDTTLVVDHAAGGCESRELYKSVLDGESRGVFQGKIIVRPGAQKTDGKMAAHALLLSEEAEANAKPELEIFADDVVCGHGATVGALDEDLLFYLRARGIPAKQAEALLIQAFVGEAIENVAHDGVREALIAATERWLKARG